MRSTLYPPGLLAHQASIANGLGCGVQVQHPDHCHHHPAGPIGIVVNDITRATGSELLDTPLSSPSGTVARFPARSVAAGRRSV